MSVHQTHLAPRIPILDVPQLLELGLIIACLNRPVMTVVTDYHLVPVGRLCCDYQAAIRESDLIPQIQAPPSPIWV